MARPGKRIVVLGLSLSSSWGNGHATTWRALLAALAAQGHDILFLERDVPWYAKNRDLVDPTYCGLRFYSEVDDLVRFKSEIRGADLVVVGSFVPDGVAVIDFVQREAVGLTAFYDIDTPVTMAALRVDRCTYLAPEQVSQFDLYLSFTGGPVLRRLEVEFGARMAREFYCSVDEQAYHPLDVAKRWDVGYLGTYSTDRQPMLVELLFGAAARLPERRFVVAGSLYPDSIIWPDNVTHIPHLAPHQHAAFYSSLRIALNVTRADMIAAGFSPSVRLFEAAACGVAIASDDWPGLSSMFTPRVEIEVVGRTQDIIDMISRSDAVLAEMGQAGRSRVLSTHTARHRSEQLMAHVQDAMAYRMPESGPVGVLPGS
jgi:spore maturation protein CgeB